MISMYYELVSSCEADCRKRTYYIQRSVYNPETDSAPQFDKIEISQQKAEDLERESDRLFGKAMQEFEAIIQEVYIASMLGEAKV